MSLLGPLPRPEGFVGKDFKLHGPWVAWFSLLSFILQPIGGNGTTAARPTNNLYVGMMYFDTTLGKPVFIKTVSGPVWVDATGSVV